MRRAVSLLFFCLAFLAAVPAGAETVFGMARQVDGDTIDIAGQKIRLLDIDAPESDQLCRDDRGSEYLCGKDASDMLRRLIRGQPVTCDGTRRDKFDRLLATCRTSDTILNREMVRRGWAVRFNERSAYLEQEIDAKKARRGIWRGEFVQPRAHRATEWETAKQIAPNGCPIKGNISQNGRIYHTPWSRWYDKTRINTAKGERWFCSEAEAIRAGWRAPLR